MTCRNCERHVSDCGPLSKRGKCAECGDALMRANALSLKNHSGPYHQYWRRRHAAAVGAILLDDIPEGR